MVKEFLSPKEFSACLGVSESTVRRWGDDGAITTSRTLGGHRRIDRSDAIRFIRESGMPVRQPRMLGLPDLEGLPDMPGRADDVRAAVRAALEAGDGGKVRGLVLSLYLAGHSIADLCDGPIASAMHHIGELWQHADNGIMIEHRATDICVGALSQLRALLPRPADDAPAAVTGALDGDPYLLPALMAATVLAAEGWRETNLGPQSPDHVILGAARETGARLVCLSISVTQSHERLTAQLVDMADALHHEDAALAVGGRALPQPFHRGRPNLHETRSMAELAAFARGLLATDPKPPSRA